MAVTKAAMHIAINVLKQENEELRQEIMRHKMKVIELISRVEAFTCADSPVDANNEVDKFAEERWGEIIQLEDYRFEIARLKRRRGK